MFFRSRNGKERAQPAPGPAQPDKPEPPPVKAPAPPAEKAATGEDRAPAIAAGQTADKSLPPEELRKRAEVSQRLAATIGEIVGLMMRSPRHRGPSPSSARAGLPFWSGPECSS